MPTTLPSLGPGWSGGYLPWSEPVASSDPQGTVLTFARAAGKKGVPTKLVDELVQSLQDFDELIRTEAGDTLAVDPRIPDAWPGFRVALRLNDGASRYRVEVENPSGRAAAVTAIELDGVPGRVDGGIGRVALLRDGADHAVRVRLG